MFCVFLFVCLFGWLVGWLVVFDIRFCFVVAVVSLDFCCILFV